MSNEESLREVALRFKSWAAEEGILSYQSPDDIYENDRDELNELTEVASPQMAASILQHRRINLVGINPSSNEIVVVTHQVTDMKRSRRA